MSSNVATLQERVHRRSGHVAAQYGDSLVIWGGYMERQDTDGWGPVTTECHYHYTDEIWVYNHITELWKRLMTSGDIPPPTCGSCGVVLGDSLFVFGGFYHSNTVFGNSNRLYRLDLETLIWHLLSPSGPAPAKCDKLTGWAHEDKVYFFGGFGPRPPFSPTFSFTVDPSTESGEQRGWNNQLVAYRPSEGAWLWPNVAGEPPCPRAAHAADISGSKVYIFGGRYMMTRRNDLCCLDLSSLRWTQCDIRSPAPSGRSWHSFTFLSPDRAIVYGGLDNYNYILSDCWSLDMTEMCAFSIPGLRDSKQHGRYWHKTVALPGVDTLAVVGGTVAALNDMLLLKDHAVELLILDFTPKSLFQLSMDAVLKGVPLAEWYGLRCLPKRLEDTLVERLEQNPWLPSHISVPP